MGNDNSDDIRYIGSREGSDQAGVTAECAICGSSESLSRYSLTDGRSIDSAIDLCPRHYRVAAVLSDAQIRDGGQSADPSFQETGKITIRVPKALIEGADAAAEADGQTRSEFVRDAMQVALDIRELEDAFDEILSEAIHSPEEQSLPAQDADREREQDADVEFLKQRIRKLESLLEDSIEKI